MRIQQLISGGLYTFLLSLCLAGATQAVEATDPARPKVALVLSGGGALGYAHIGVLEVLEEMHVPIDCVVGTSMGALVGGTYSAGVSPERMKHVIVNTNVTALFDDEPHRSEIPTRLKRDEYRPLFEFNLGLNDNQIQLPAGASAGYKFELFLKELLGAGAAGTETDFDQLPTPYRAVATDLETGAMKVFSQGELTRIMRASMSLPAIVAPTEVNDGIYVDGGMVRNLPIDIGRELCGDLVIAVNLGTKPKTREDLKSSLDVARQSITLLVEQNVTRSLSEITANDILISPDLDGFEASSFDEQEEIIARGAAAARAHADQLARLAVSPQSFDAWLAERRARIHPPPEVTAITAVSTEEISGAAILRDVTTGTGEDFELEQLNKDIARIYGRGDFSYIGYSIFPAAEGANVVINAQRKPWGPGYLKFGLGTATDFNSPTQLVLAASYRRTWINSLGAEWRSDLQLGYDSLLSTELTQPLQFRDGAFLALYGGVGRTFVQVYDDDIRLGDVTVKRASAGIDFGLTGTAGEIRLGPFASHTRTTPDFGVLTPILSEHDSTQIGILLRGIYDQLDSPGFPRSGLLVRGSLSTLHESWGSDDEFTRAQFALGGATSFGENTLYGHLEWGEELTNDGNLPIQDAFKLGGPRRLSGLFLDQLTGSSYQLAAMSYYYRFATLPSQIGRGLYLGFSVEAGRIDDPFMDEPWDWIRGGSVFWGADTILGPAYAGYGRSSLNQDAWYLTIGPQFSIW